MKFLPALLFTASLALAAAPEKKPGACCAVLDAAAFSRESIYQLDGRFIDDHGKPFALGALRGQPVVVDLFFASCGYACPLTVADLVAVQDRLAPGLRRQAAFVLVSFDTARDTPEVLAAYRTRHALDGQWILLHGDEAAVRELAALLGVKYKLEADGAFSHSNLVTILNREGEIVHQRKGHQGGPEDIVRALGATGEAW